MSWQNDFYDGLLKLINAREWILPTGSRLDRFMERKKAQSHIDRSPAFITEWMSRDLCFHREECGGRPLFRFSNPKRKPRGAFLYLFGGGFIRPLNPFDFSFARKIALTLDMEVFLPEYPLMPKAKHHQIARSVGEVYEYMISNWKPKECQVGGASAGAFLSLSLFAQRLIDKNPLPFPAHILLLSPGSYVPAPKEYRAEMERLDEFDTLVSVALVDSLTPYLLDRPHPEGASPLYEGFEELPPTTLLMGTCEVLYPCCKDFKQFYKERGGDLTVKLGEGMGHVWPLRPGVPEAKEARTFCLQRIQEFLPKQSISANKDGDAK